MILTSVKSHLCFCFRFFLMYLINKDETEHTGQVSKYRDWFETNIDVSKTKVQASLVFFGIVNFESRHSPTLHHFSGVICVEDVPGTMLGLLPCWRLLQEAVWGPAWIKSWIFTLHPMEKERREKIWNFKIKHICVLVLSFACTVLSSVKAMHTLTALLYHLQQNVVGAYLRKGE